MTLSPWLPLSGAATGALVLLGAAGTALARLVQGGGSSSAAWAAQPALVTVAWIGLFYLFLFIQSAAAFHVFNLKKAEVGTPVPGPAPFTPAPFTPAPFTPRRRSDPRAAARRRTRARSRQSSRP